jgi:hypothetical protein
VLWNRVRDIDDPEESSGTGLTDGHARALASSPILVWSPENLFDLVLRDAVRVDVWHTRRGIKVVSNRHVADATTASRTLCAMHRGISSIKEA